MAVASALTQQTLRADDAYIGHLTTWSNPAAWSNNAPPTSTDNVFITPSLDPSEIDDLTLDTTATIANLTLGAAPDGIAVLNLNANSLTATSTTITPNGQIVGTGALSSPINNAGSISASGNLLTLALNQQSTPSTNTGTLAALSAPDLLLKNALPSDFVYAPINNTGGTISALGAPSDSTPTTVIDLNNIAINGGQILTNASGQLRVKLESSISNATIAGNVLLQDSLILSNDTISGNISASGSFLLALGGRITSNATISPMTVTLVSNTTLDGAGTTNINGLSAQFPATLTIGPSHTVQGSAILGGNNLTALTNSGTISANSPTSGLSVSGASNATFSNNGTLQAVNGATLSLGSSSSTFNNANGVISATGASANGTPSKVAISNLAISGGQLLTDNTAHLALSNVSLSDLSVTGNLLAPSFVTFSNVTFSQAVTLSGSGAISGSIINNANTAIPAGANISITTNQPLQLSGTGTLTLNGGNLTQTGNATLAILPGQSVQGYGMLSLASNAGNVTANTAAQFLFINPTSPSATIAGNGTFAAIAGGKLVLDSLCQISGATISAAGGNVTNPSTITVGLQSPASSVANTQFFTDSISRISLGNLTLSNDTLSGNFSFLSGGLLQNSTLVANVTSTGTATIAGTITNNATWFSTTLRISSVANLTGSGSIILTGGTINRATGANATLTIAPTATIRGFGGFNTVAGSFNLALDNQGTIAADANPTGNATPSASPLTLPILLPSTSSGTLSAVNNGAFQLLGSPGASLDNTNGTISANGGNISLSNLSLTGGQLLSAPANTISLAGNITLNGSITANATLLGAANLSLTLAPSAAVNLLHGALILHITDPSTLPTVQSEIAAGTSSDHTAGLFTTTPNLALALIDNSSLTTPFTTFAGQQVSPNSLLITPALPGDTNLDNTVDLTDLSTLLNNFGQPTPNWTAGNFDHAPTIDLTDLSDLLNNFGATNPNASTSQLPITNYQLPAPTPEPTSLAVRGLGATALLTRRRNA